MGNTAHKYLGEPPSQPQPNAAVVFEANVGLLLLLKLLLLECVVAALFMRSWVARVGGMITAALRVAKPRNADGLPRCCGEGRWTP